MSHPPPHRFDNIFDDLNEIYDYIAPAGVQRLLATNNPKSLLDKIEALYSLSYKMIKIPSKKAEDNIPCCYRCSFLHALKEQIDELMNRILENKENERLEELQRNKELNDEYQRRYFGEPSGVNQNNSRSTTEDSNSSKDSEDSD